MSSLAKQLATASLYTPQHKVTKRSFGQGKGRVPKAQQLHLSPDPRAALRAAQAKALPLSVVDPTAKVWATEHPAMSEQDMAEKASMSRTGVRYDTAAAIAKANGSEAAKMAAIMLRNEAYASLKSR